MEANQGLFSIEEVHYWDHKNTHPTSVLGRLEPKTSRLQVHFLNHSAMLSPYYMHFPKE